MLLVISHHLVFFVQLGSKNRTIKKQIMGLTYPEEDVDAKSGVAENPDAVGLYAGEVGL